MWLLLIKQELVHCGMEALHHGQQRPALRIRNGWYFSF